MSLFVIGDLHLSLDTNKSMDIFPGWENYVQQIYDNWHRLVGEEDTVVLAGDISWAMKLEETKKDFEFIHNLPGRKIILKGNHDYWWNTVSKMDKFITQQGFHSISFLNNNSFLVDGISVCGSRGWINETGEELDKKVLLREAGRLESSLEQGKSLGGELIVFIHYPPIYGGEENQYILDVLNKYQVKRCYYGHIHGAGSKRALNGICRGIEYQLISADFIKFSPVLVNRDKNLNSHAI